MKGEKGGIEKGKGRLIKAGKMRQSKGEEEEQNLG